MSNGISNFQPLPLSIPLKKSTTSKLQKKNTNQEKRNISSNQTTGGDPSGFDKSSFHTLHISQNNTNNVVVDNNSPSSTKTDNNNVSINTTPTKKVATQKKVVAPQIKQLLQLRQDLKNDISDIASLKNNAGLLLVTDIMTFGTVVPIKLNLATSAESSTIYQKALAITSVVCNTGTIVSSVASMAFPPAAFVTAGFAFASIFTDAAMFVNTVKNLNTASNANPGMRKSYNKAIQKHAITLLGNTAKNLLFCIPGVAAGVAAGSAALGFAATLTLPSFITAKSILITAGVSKVFTTVPVLRKSLKKVVRRLGLKVKVKKNSKKEKILAAAVTAKANADNGFQKLTSQPKKKQKVYMPKMFSKKFSKKIRNS